MLIGAALFLMFQSPLSAYLNNETINMTSRFYRADELSYCEVFFSGDQDRFEQQINAKIEGAKLIQSNIIWSEATSNLGYYGLICY